MNKKEALQLIQSMDVDHLCVVIPFEHEVSETLFLELRKYGYEVYAEIATKGQQLVVVGEYGDTGFARLDV